MPLSNVLSIRVRPESSQRYEELLRELAERARKKKDPGSYACYQQAMGELGVFHFVSEDADFAGLAARGTPQLIVHRVLGEKEGPRWEKEALACTTEARQEVAIDRPDLSYPPEDLRIRPAAVITTIRARPGHQDAAEEVLRKVAEAIPKVGDPGRLVTHQVVIGAMGAYWAVRPIDGLAELDGQLPPDQLLTQAFGTAEGGLILRSGLDAIESMQRDVVVYREDLSNPPA